MSRQSYNFLPDDPSSSQHRSYASDGGRERREAIRAEIHRFESVHPCIYAIYDLLDLLIDQPVIAQQIRDQVVCIEDSFVNSQEWTMSRTVPDLKLGVLGSLSSGKTALVHRYLTGTYMQDESPEGGRFKKELVIDGTSYLLLIRDEGGPPEQQFAEWVDAVLLVFSLDSESSFASVWQYYQRLAHYRNPAEIPLVLVGTQDAISESRPRLVEDSRARELAAHLKRCSYFETCATYGLNVDKVFREACSKILSTRDRSKGGARGSPIPPIPPPPGSCPSTPNHGGYGGVRNGRAGGAYYSEVAVGTPARASTADRFDLNSASVMGPSGLSPSSTFAGATPLKMRDDIQRPSAARLSQALPNEQRSGESENTVPTPSSTPNPPRKTHSSTTRRISNIFRAPKDEARNGWPCGGGELGSGRAIPIKQGILYKKAGKSINSKEWKKKFFCLHSDGRLVYHNSIKDYMEDAPGKEIFLGLATVKLPPPPKAKKAPEKLTPGPVVVSGSGSGSISTAYDSVSEGAGRPSENASDNCGEADSATSGGGGASGTTPHAKKKRHAKRGGPRMGEEGEAEEVSEFVVVSADEKQWHLEAETPAERDDWVAAIQDQIGKSLQGQLSQKQEAGRVTGDRSAVAELRALPGNRTCADCGAPGPAWASLNLGVLLCIDCSGVHRKLGAHLSRVRSLDLDEWPPELLLVMKRLGGNSAVNEYWEAAAPASLKPGPDAKPEARQAWIRRKYEKAEFRRPLPIPSSSKSLHSQLVDAVLSSDLGLVVSILVEAERSGDESAVNRILSLRDHRTPLHLACSLTCPEMVQMLLWHGADPKAVDGEGRNGLWYAEENGDAVSAHLLIAAGASASTSHPAPPSNPPPPRPPRRSTAVIGKAATTNS